MIINKTKIKQALEAKMPVSDLSAEEQEIFFEEFLVLMQKKSTPEQEAAFRKHIQTY